MPQTQDLQIPPLRLVKMANTIMEQVITQDFVNTVANRTITEQISNI
jgi:hypothetical protein